MATSRKPSTRKRWHPWRNVLLALAAVSLFQYATTGGVSWPAEVARKVGGTLRDYADRPGASWRRAADKLEEMGAAQEGQPVPDFDLTGRVVRVADGDTISVLDHTNTQHRVRLQGIDTPERDQPYGKQAWKALATLVADRQVGVVVLGEDSYGRSNGVVYLDGGNINLAMVAGGHAWWYRHYAPHNRQLADAEARARAQRLGLWAQADPVPPWDWRRQQRYAKP